MLRGKAKRIFGRGDGGRDAEGGVGVMDNVSLDIYEVGDVFVAVVEVIREETRRREEDERAGGDRLGGGPDIRLEEGVIGASELLDAEVVVVNEALKGFCSILHGAHFDSAAHAVEGHGDHDITGLPPNGAVFGVVQNRPNAGLGLDEGLISHLAHARGRMYSIVVVLGREVVDGGVLVKVIGGVGFAFGGGTISDVIVGIGNFVFRDYFIANVVT